MKIRGLSRNVIVLGWVSFFTDVASEMLYPVMPLFLVGVLGGSPALLGLIDGIAEGGSSILRWLAGAYSDRVRRRKPFVTAGYTISALSKPIMGLAAFAVGWPLFLLGRTADRLGKSVRTSARDALIADSTAPDRRGLAFGLHRAMDTSGAVLGPLVVVVILLVKPGFPLAYLFFIALAPGLISALLASLLVKEMPRDPAQAKKAKRPPLFQSYPRPFWGLIVAVALFSLGNSADTFLILRSKELGLSFIFVILAYVLFNVVYAAAAIPFGRMSDRVGRKPLIITGWLMYAGVYFGFACAKTAVAPWVLFAFYGMYQAMSEGITKAMVSDLVPPEQRAGAIGLFYTVSGVGQLTASLIVGVLWNARWFDGRCIVGLLIGSLFALAAIPVIAAVPGARRMERGSA